ncbi:hypothetical protein DL96DRAFT_975190 [Flagelloscypha sp. PMI_526]|nr:hypothetical protein DL96DRAFT_975190 [Flagelloscypha sp. PMI_526]
MLWISFNTLHTSLFGACLCSPAASFSSRFSSFPPSLESNLLTLSFATYTFLFALCNLTGSLLIWTGNAFNTEPPYEVCLANAAFTLANTPVMAAAAFSLVVQVSSTVLFVHYPLLKGWFGWLTKVPLLLVIPLITGLPILVVGLNRGLRHPDQVLRGSPFYCTMEAPKLNIIVSIIAAVLELHCLVLASWTTIALLRTRWRVRSRATDVIDGPFNRPLVIRVLAFSFTNLMGFILAIATAVLSFSMVATDLMFSLIGCIVVVIFGWVKILSLWFFLPSSHNNI